MLPQVFITFLGTSARGFLALQCSCVLTRSPAVSKVLMMLNLDGSLAARTLPPATSGRWPLHITR
jgi:hypothetical protein